jgi:hypothetical protein
MKGLGSWNIAVLESMIGGDMSGMGRTRSFTSSVVTAAGSTSDLVLSFMSSSALMVAGSASDRAR